MTQTIDLASIDTENLSIDEIDNLISELTTTLEEDTKDQSVEDRIQSRYETEWDFIKNKMTTEFHDSMVKEKEEFILRESIKIVLNKSIGPELTKEFIGTLNSCIRTRSFMGSQAFYQKTKSQNVRDIARIAFFVYRYHKYQRTNAKYLAYDSIIREIRNLINNSTNITMRTAIEDFRSLDLLVI